MGKMPFSPHIIPVVSNYWRRSVKHVFPDMRTIILTVQYYARRRKWLTCYRSDSRMRLESFKVEQRAGNVFWYAKVSPLSIIKDTYSKSVVRVLPVLSPGVMKRNEKVKVREFEIWTCNVNKTFLYNWIRSSKLKLHYHKQYFPFLRKRFNKK